MEKTNNCGNSFLRGGCCMKKSSSAFLVCIFFLLFIVSGCKKENNSVNEDTIKEVLSELLNLPNEKLFKSIQNYSDQVVSGEVDNSKEPEYLSILENMFYSQFTDEGYEKFINETAMYYITTTQDAGFITKVKDVNVTQNKDDKLRYSFTATINYTDNNNESGTTKISGNAEFKEKGKLTIFKITTNDLLEKMKKIANEVKIPKE